MLLKADYVIIPKVNSLILLVLSVILVYMGFYFDCIAWFKTLKEYGKDKVTLNHAFVSMGLSIFGKYMPGKLWTIIGRGAYIAEKYKYSRKEIASLSLNAQFITLWTGLLIGFISTFILKINFVWHIIMLFLWILISINIFSRVFHDLFSKIINLVLKKRIEIPSLSISMVLKVLPWFVMSWLCWCLGFYVLAQSLVTYPINPSMGFVFSLAGTVGIMAFIVPGGIGIREGVIGTILTFNGLNQELALSISITSRLWFLLGELLIFCTGILLYQFINKNKEYED